MSTLKFTPEMFSRRGLIVSDDVLAMRAQDIYDKWLSEQPVVYTSKLYEQGHTAWNYDNIVDASQGATFTARLVDIQPIEKPKCEHEPVLFITNGLAALNGHLGKNPKLECNKCGKALNATFTEAE